MLLADAVTTSFPGTRAAARCAFCRGVLLVNPARLDRIWSGEDEPWCDDCIPAALAAAAFFPNPRRNTTTGEPR